MKTLLFISNPYTLLDEIAAHFSKAFRVVIANYEAGELRERMREEPEAILDKMMSLTKKKKIMLIDDDAMQLRSMNAILKEKYEVSMAPSGILAMTLLGKSIPDLILLDYEMPICDGPQTLAMIRGEETYKDIPVIFLTGVNDKEKIMKVLEYKPQGYLLKSLPSEEILSKIEQFFA